MIGSDAVDVSEELSMDHSLFRDITLDGDKFNYGNYILVPTGNKDLRVVPIDLGTSFRESFDSLIINIETYPLGQTVFDAHASFYFQKEAIQEMKTKHPFTHDALMGENFVERVEILIRNEASGNHLLLPFHYVDTLKKFAASYRHHSRKYDK